MYERRPNKLAVHKDLAFAEVEAYDLKAKEKRDVYDTFILDDNLGPLQAVEDQVTTLAVRELTPSDRRKKYRTVVVECKVSSDPKKYKDILQVRFQRGLLHPEPWSIEIIKRLPGLLVVKATEDMPKT